MYLNCHSYFSLRYGTISVEDLVQLGVANQAKSLALTDINCVTGIYDFVLECRAHTIKPLVGIEFRNGSELLFIGLAKNKAAIGEMCLLLTKHNFENTKLPRRIEFNNTYVIYPLETAPTELKEYEYIGIRPEELFKLYKPELKKHLGKMVVLQPVTFRGRDEYNLHRILRAIEGNVILSRLEAKELCRKNEVMLPYDQVLLLYKEYPQIIKNTERLIEDCNFDFDFKAPKNKKHYTQNRYSDKELLTSLAYEGMVRRYGKHNKEALFRVNKELDVIDKLGFAGYFLITWDIVRYSNSCGFMHVGRGSGANSIVSYCLGITAICPIELNLYFERFLNASRTSPPDFDIDWSHRDRDTILDYIFKRFDSRHVAFCGTIAEFKFRSKIRELGKVFGLPKEEMDVLIKGRPKDHEQNKIVAAIHKYGGMLEKHPNQRSMHSCGVLISEEPITNYTALEMPPKGFPIVQFDMHIAEDIGFEKFDILSQRGISSINETVKLVKQNRGVVVDIRDTTLSKNEATANEWLKTGKTIGCFYIESPAMRGLLRRLQCENYITLVAASSIIRPGVAQSGMMTEYIFRHKNPDKFEYFHPVFEKELGDTYGVMVYQEDVIKIAIHFGGISPEKADILRRSISGKKRSLKELQTVKEDFFLSCDKQGHARKLSEEVYRQIESFAGYSFCKAHSASYAVESYQALYLKVNYPIEFMVAVINNGGGFYRPEVYIHEARMSGAKVHAPCVNRSNVETTLYGNDIYLGFHLIDGLQAEVLETIVRERQNGNYSSLEEFIGRVPIGLEGIQTLIFAGAFRFIGKNKNELILSSRLLMAHKPEQSSGLLFQEPTKELKLPKFIRSVYEDVFDEIETVGFPVSLSPFDLLITKQRGDVMAKDLANQHGKTIRMMGYLISRKQVPTKRGDMNFGTWIDVEGTFFDTAHFADSLSAFPFQGGGCYLLLGKVQVEYGFPTVTVVRMAKLPFVPDPRFADDKDLRQKVQGQLNEDVSLTHRAPYPSEQEIGLPRFKMLGL
ncbi:DNA polymerase III subunit alpha [Aurantibacillus circumpalustris]|uniref:DNA polymerase III subunit alpha n=1 Tax=Aurantibacillus circumpalustris TaxID=3036359 RepID=UPI00295B2111|nr:DNA polymerase III subunit alpha [Aurantibacillus circumpalustris]